jgi:hypothetical protein
MPKRGKLIAIVALYTAIVGGIGYRLGYEQNPCAAFDIILQYPQENVK